MNTCKATLRVLAAHRLYLIIYLVLIGIMMFTISGAQLTGNKTSDNDTYTPGRATVAVIDRDADRGHIADTMRSYLSVSHDVTDLADEPQTLQQAVASNWVDLIVIIPSGYADGLIAAVSSGETLPKVETVTSYTSGVGSMASMSVNGFLSMTRIALIGDNVTVSAEDWKAKYNGVDGQTADGNNQPSQNEQSDQDTLDMLPEGRVQHLSLDDVAKAAQQVQTVARDKTANHAIAVDHSDQTATDTDTVALATRGFGTTMKTALYPLFLAMTVCTALVISVFNAGETRRRLLASPQRASVMGLERLAVICVFAMIVVAVYVVATLGLMLAAGLNPSQLALSGVVMTVVAACAYALMTVACGFMLGEYGLSDTMTNGFANLFGLLIMFTSGISFPPDMMPAPMLAIGHMLPGWWYCVAIDNAFGIGTASQQGSDVMSWASSVGLVMLFGIAFICIGLAVGRIRRTRSTLVTSTQTQLAEVV